MAQSAAICDSINYSNKSGNITSEGFGISIYHYNEGSKTNPPEFNSSSQNEPKKQESNNGDLQKKALVENIW
jgi:hypothetical protein